MDIEFRGVSLAYGSGEGRVEALKNFDWKLEPGGFAAVMGKTGSGKSTILRLLSALVKPDAGKILVGGKDINSSYPRRELRRNLGFVFQFPEYQLFETTALKEVCFGMKNLGFSKGEMEENSRWALEKLDFNFEAVKNVPPMSLSGGQRRRIAIAAVIASRPKILLLDEPTSGLDPAERKKFVSLLKSLNAEGTSIIMVSHNSQVACEAAHSLLVLKDGKKWREGRAEELFLQDLSAAGILPPPAVELSSFLRGKGMPMEARAREGEFLKALAEARKNAEK